MLIGLFLCNVLKSNTLDYGLLKPPQMPIISLSQEDRGIPDRREDMPRKPLDGTTIAY